MRSFQETIHAEDGLELNYYRWIPKRAHSAVVISHGWSEHAGRYDRIARWFSKHGYEVHALDHRGHGQSKGARGHVENWLDYARDLEQLRQSIEHEDQFLLGHSMGGMISVLHMLKFPDRFNAVALSGPATDVSIEVPKLKYWVSKALNQVWPTLALKNNIDPTTVCSDENVVNEYIHDPLNHGSVSIRWFTEYLSMIEKVKAEAPEIQTPVAIWHGDGDALVEPWVSEQFFERLTMPKRKRALVENTYHEILYEPCWADVAGEMKTWFEQSVA